MEKFLREARAVSLTLDTAYSQMVEKMHQNDNVSPQDLLRQHRHLQDSVVQTPEQVIREGTSNIYCLVTTQLTVQYIWLLCHHIMILLPHYHVEFILLFRSVLTFSDVI